jgi:hypothetical protein
MRNYDILALKVAIVEVAWPAVCSYRAYTSNSTLDYIIVLQHSAGITSYKSTVTLPCKCTRTHILTVISRTARQLSVVYYYNC